MSSDIGFAAQTPSLPTAGGGAGGLGETFAPDLSTGTGTFAVELDLPNGPNDIGPELCLRYDTGNPNGPFGLGWTLPLPRLIRSTSRGRPEYGGDLGGTGDALILEGAGPLVADGAGGLRPEVDTGDWRIAPGPSGEGYLVTDRAGTRFALGTTAQSRIDGVGAPWAWLLSEIEDNLGNTATYHWRSAGPQRYLAEIAYGGYRVRFGYERRPDPLRWSRAGFVLATDERCARISLHLDPARGTSAGPADEEPSVVREWDLGYTVAEPTGASVLSSITLTGTDRHGGRLSAPPLTLGYAAPGPVRLREVVADDPRDTPPGPDGRGRIELMDWDGDGLPDLVEISAGGNARVWPNRQGHWGRSRTVAGLPTLAGEARAALIDLDGNGLADAVRVDVPATGYQPRDRTGFTRPLRWSAGPSVAIDAPQARLVDLDGDGVADLVWSTGRSLLLAHRTEQGWQQRPLVVAARADGLPTDLADPHVHCADMTGDGTPDLVRVDGRGVTYWPYLGRGAFGAAVRMGTPPALPHDLRADRLFVVDLAGDGCADLLYLDDRAGAVRWWPNCAGDHFRAERTIRHVPVATITAPRIADLLGTGRPALCWSAPAWTSRGGPARTRWYALDPLGGTCCGLLEHIDSGTGDLTRIDYGTSAAERARDRAAGADWPATLPFVLPVVTSITVTDRITGRTDTTRYRYHDGRYDDVRREFCGFGRVDQEDPGDAHVPVLTTTRWFHTGLRADDAEPVDATERGRLRAIRGRLIRQDHRDPRGTLLDRVEHTWEAIAGDRPTIAVPRMRRTTTSTFDGAPESAPARQIATETTRWDADGNILEQVERGFTATPIAPAPATRTLRTRMTYATDPAGRYRQRICRVRQEDADGAVLADTLTMYDDRPPGTVGAHGLVTARFALVLTDESAAEVYGDAPPDWAALGYLRRPEGPGWWVRLGAYTRSVAADGTIHGTLTGIRGHVSTLAMDPTGCYPARVTDAVGNTVTADFDPRCCQPVELTEPSGATRRARFDALARPVTMIEPGADEAEPTVTYAYRSDRLPIVIEARHRGALGGPPLERRDLLDGAGRLLERRSRDEIGEVTDSCTQFGARGLPVRHYLPHRPTSEHYTVPDPTRPHAELFYDALGRPLRTIGPDGTTLTVHRLPDGFEETDAAGRTVRHHVDASGRTVRTDEESAGHTHTATFQLDLKGNLLEHTDPAGSTSRFRYDLFGRLLRTERPEATHVAVLDPAGNSVESRSGGAVVLRTFDRANRIAEVRHGSAAAAPVLRCIYHDNGSPAPADAGAHTAGGRLVRVDDEGGGTVLDYDACGRIAVKTMTVAGVAALAGRPPLRLVTAYRPDGLPDTVTYPALDGAAPLVASYHYDRRGRLIRLDGVVDAIDYDLADRRVATRFANGVVRTEERDPRTGWSTVDRLDGPAGALREVRHTHDVLGNLTRIDSPTTELCWEFAYDDRSQLVGATGGGPAAPLAYTYGAGGDRLTATGDGAYGYGGDGAAPTCLTSVGTDTFGYDACGRLTSAPWGTHTLDAEGRLRAIDLTSGGREEFTYGHHGGLVRRVRRDAAGAVIGEVACPDSLVRIEDGELVVQFTDGAAVVARHHVADGRREWLHTDHTGSLVLVTDAAGAVVLERRYDPFGRVLAATGPASAPQGVGGGEDAGSGLVLLGARWYCPRLGRFVSPDPLVGDAYDALAWNAYAYCRNNPTSYTDPTGRQFWKVFVSVVAAVAIIALVVVVSVCTFGVGTPGAIALGGVTWGAVFAATMTGIVAGGVVGGIAAARAGGSAADIALGICVGGLVGGGAAFAGAFAGAAAAAGMGLSGVVGGAVAGGISGTINGAAMGFAAGFAGSRNKGFTDVMEKVLVGAIIGAAAGAALGAVSGITPPKGSVGDTLAKASQPPYTPEPPLGQVPPAPVGSSLAPVNNLGQAASETAVGMAGHYAGALFPHAAAPFAHVAGSTLTQTVLVDLHAAGTLVWDDFQTYLRRNRIELGLLDFIKDDLR